MRNDQGVTAARKLPSLKVPQGSSSSRPPSGRKVAFPVDDGKDVGSPLARRSFAAGENKMSQSRSMPMARHKSLKSPSGHQPRLTSKSKSFYSRRGRAWTDDEEDEAPELQVFCANCGQMGHLAMKCPNPKTKAESPRHRKQDKMVDEDAQSVSSHAKEKGEDGGESDSDSDSSQESTAVSREFGGGMSRSTTFADKDTRLTGEKLEAVLKGFKFYQDQDFETQAKLRARVVRLKERKGKVLFRQGDPAGNAYVLLSGEVGIYVLRDDQEQKEKEEAKDDPVEFEYETARPKCDPARIKKVASAVLAAIRMKREGSVKTAQASNEPDGAGAEALARVNSGPCGSERSTSTAKMEVHMTVEGYSCYGEDTNLGERVGAIGPGEFFGEIALIYGQVRSATIKCLQDSELLVVKGDDFNELCKKRMLQQSDDKLKFLVQHVPGLRDHQVRRRANGQTKDVSHCWRRVTFPKGHTFLSQGSRSQPALYVVTTGTVEFLRNVQPASSSTARPLRTAAGLPLRFGSESSGYSPGIADADAMHNGGRRRQYWGMEGMGFLGVAGSGHQLDESSCSKRDMALRGRGERPSSAAALLSNEVWTSGASAVRVFGSAKLHARGASKNTPVQQGGDWGFAAAQASEPTPVMSNTPPAKPTVQPRPQSRGGPRPGLQADEIQTPLRSTPPRPASSGANRRGTPATPTTPARREAQEQLTRMCHGLDVGSEETSEASKNSLTRRLLRPGSSSSEPSKPHNNLKRVATLASGGLFGSLPLNAEEPFTVVVTSSTCEVLCVVGQEVSKIPMRLYDIIKEYLADTTSWRLKNVMSSQAQLLKLKSASAPSLPSTRAV
mmetsp:Transcript_25155/g.58426  ORF Transcript_25155/g.58426 Transcript_25155/m.58426 type:complete len:840 (+) Transcript_25155:97-2616(+)